jgi:hypothetical protein
MNPRRTPGWIFSRHPEDQIPKLLPQRPSSKCFQMPRTPAPIKSKTGAMPADHGFRLDDHQCFLPLRPRQPDHRPEQAIKVTESWLWVFSFESYKLLAESKIFQQNIAS